MYWSRLHQWAVWVGLSLALACSLAAHAANEGRVALVIGNAAYREAPLVNPVNDATDMARTLEKLGFKVILKRNVGTRDMRQAIREFGLQLRQAQVGLFYFAGHGIQVKGSNFLIPVGADIQNEADAEDLSIDANYVMRTMEEANTKVSIVVLDACRNNPFARSFRSTSRGLGQMTAATGSIIAFATAPGSVAADGAGRNGVYTKHLLDSLRQGDSDVLKVFQRVRAAVVKETAGRQTPWESTSLVGDFFFRSAPATPGPAAGMAPAAASPSAREQELIDLTFWQSVKDSKNDADFVAYLERFPEGHFAALARGRLDRERQELAALIAAEPRPFAALAVDLSRSGLPRTFGAAAKGLKEKLSAERSKTLLAMYQRDAESGDPVALYSVGSIYYWGIGVAEDRREAEKWYRQAAERDDAIAQFALGYVAQSGGLGTADYAEARKWYVKAAEHNFPPALERLGFLYMQGLGVTRNQTEAVNWYRKAAELGFTDAQSSLGVAYVQGDGVAKDAVEAVKWFRKAAEKGHTHAQSWLGWAYFGGHGVGKDDTEAVNWTRQAAEKGHGYAQEKMGSAYFNGRGVAKDETEAAKWYRRAADAGISSAQASLGWAYLYGRGVVKDETEGLKWTRKAADQGIATAQDNLGLVHLNGRGVAKDSAEAVRWFRKAAEQGHAGGQNNLGAMYARGEGIAKDEIQALSWYRKSAEQGYPVGQTNLGFAYVNGQGVAKDEVEAVKWFRKAAEQGHATAQRQLGLVYLNGRGVAKDEAEAARWLRMAAAKGDEFAKEQLKKISGH